MATYLFIGGSADGLRKEIELVRPTLEIFVMPKHDLFEKAPEDESVKVELYELQRFVGTEGRNYEVMVFTGLQQDVIGRLIAGYYPDPANLR